MSDEESQRPPLSALITHHSSLITRCEGAYASEPTDLPAREAVLAAAAGGAGWGSGGGLGQHRAGAVSVAAVGAAGAGELAGDGPGSADDDEPVQPGLCGAAGRAELGPVHAGLDAAVPPAGGAVSGIRGDAAERRLSPGRL